MTYEELMAGWDQVSRQMDEHTERMNVIRSRVIDNIREERIRVEGIVERMCANNEQYAAAMAALKEED